MFIPIPHCIMRNIKLILEYDGTNYCGFQKQKQHNTIQRELEKALSRLCNEPIRVTSSGRTDSGVHARGHVVNFTMSRTLTKSNIIKGANSYLPKDIVVKSVRFVSASFHARFSARRKIYQYHLWNAPVRTPLRNRYCYHYIFPLNIADMKKAAKVLVGKRDFKAFCAQGRKKENTIRHLRRITIRKKGYLITFTFEGNGFLYNMVRNIVGTLLLAGRGKLFVSDVKKILSSKDRMQAGPTAPPQGLMLMKVLYI
ncbi:MAG: tRNA pseudouridine(38-40) synthase TruA [Candidatus Omnitrophica bacterium]|nr:tRNA pseudouridine(38-40) synthase TruA [Candidatus Omnitrophota bacterium]